MRRRRTTGLAAIALACTALITLSACGGSGDEGASASPSIVLPDSAMATTPAGDSGAVVGGDASTWSPILIKKKTKSVTLVPGQIALFPAFEYAANPNYIAVSSDPAVVEVLEADKNSAVALKAVGPGDAVVKIYKGTDQGGQGKYLRKVKVSVSQE